MQSWLEFPSVISFYNLCDSDCELKIILKKVDFRFFHQILEISVYLKKALTWPLWVEICLPKLSSELEIVLKQFSWMWRHILIPKSFSETAQNHFWAPINFNDVYVVIFWVYFCYPWMCEQHLWEFREASEYCTMLYQDPQ